LQRYGTNITKPHLSRRRFGNIGRLGAKSLWGVAVATARKLFVKPAQDWQIQQDLECGLVMFVP